jgi:hypothetical protein
VQKNSRLRSSLADKWGFYQKSISFLKRTWLYDDRRLGVI